MEAPKYVEMKPKVDIRQSDGWGKYLSKLGWRSHRIGNGANIMYRRTFLGSVVKIQHPPVLKTSDLKEIEDFCKGIGAMFIKIEPFLDQDMSIFKKAGYRDTKIPNIPTSTMYMNLTKSEENLWLALSRSGKYSVRRAQREGSVVEFIQDPSKEILKTHYDIVLETGRKKHFYVPPISDFLARAKAFGKDCYITFVYDKDENIVGSKMFLCCEDMVLYSTGGTTSLGREGKSGYEILWRSILYFKSLGYKVLDLEGVDDDRFPEIAKRWGGFSHFKEKFGGETVRFSIPQIKFLSPFLKLMSKFTTVPL